MDIYINLDNNYNKTHIDLKNNTDQNKKDYISLKSNYIKINKKMENMTKTLEEIENIIVKHKYKNREYKIDIENRYYEPMIPDTIEFKIRSSTIRSIRSQHYR